MVISLKQFRDRYPAASMTSELLMVQGEQFVVQVTIQTPAAVTVNGMAADIHLEAAEDRARQRALEGLGEGERLEELPERSLAPMPEPLKKSTPVKKLAGKATSRSEPTFPAEAALSPSPSLEFPKKSDLEVSEPLAKPQNLAQQIEEPAGVSVPMPQPITTSEPDSTPASTPAQSTVKPEEKFPQAASDIPVPEIPVPEIPVPEIPARDIPVPDMLPDPVNLSDVIAQTDVELRRLGWSVADGREYLESTYNKRSRHDLTDEELLAFLLHLESLSDPQPVE
ncbi:MAG: hypothetical protein AAFY20_01280 [Cyanobacteria bacterium J06639_14]